MLNVNCICTSHGAIITSVVTRYNKQTLKGLAQGYNMSNCKASVDPKLSLQCSLSCKETVNTTL